MVEFLRDSLIV